MIRRKNSKEKNRESLESCELSRLHTALPRVRRTWSEKKKPRYEFDMFKERERLHYIRGRSGDCCHFRNLTRKKTKLADSLPTGGLDKSEVTKSIPNNVFSLMLVQFNNNSSTLYSLWKTEKIFRRCIVEGKLKK